MADELLDLAAMAGLLKLCKRQISRLAQAGFIYHITPEQADKARRELGLPPLAVKPAP